MAVQASVLQRTRFSIAFILVVIIPTIFYRGIFDAFDLTKYSLLMVVGAMLVGLEVFEANRNVYRTKRILFLLLATLLAALLTSALISGRIEWSFVGQYQRYTGVYTGLVCLLTVSFVSKSNGIEVRRISLWMTVAGSICALYAYLQVLDNDPFQWSSNSFGELVTGTLGNPNTSAGFVGLSVPFALAMSESVRSRIRFFYAGVAGFLAGSLVLFASALVLLTLLGVLLFVSKLAWSQLSVGRLIWLILWFALCSLPFFPEIRELSPLVGAVGALGGSLVGSSKSRFFLSAPFGRGTILGIAIAISLTSGALFWSRLVGFLEDGLSERKFFFGAAVRIFAENPIFGSGPESFGLLFNEFRSEESAKLYEYSISSSAHNYYLGAISNGGLIVGLSLFALVVVTIWRSSRKIVKTPGDLHFLAAFCAAVGLLFQMFVQVEHVVLVTIASVICGLLWVADTQSLDGAKTFRRRKSFGSQASFQRVAISFAAIVIALVGALTFGTKSFRADSEYRNSFDPNSTFEQRKLDLEQALDLAPWEPTYRFALIQLLASVEDYSSAGSLALRAAEDSNYVNTVMPSLVSVVLNSGDVNLAANLSMEALEKNPFADQMNQAILDISNSMIDNYGAQLSTESLALWQKVQQRAEERLNRR